MLGPLLDLIRADRSEISCESVFISDFLVVMVTIIDIIVQCPVVE